MFDLAPLVLAFPIAGVLLNLLFGRYLNERWISIIGVSAVGGAFVVAILQALALAGNGHHAHLALLADWIEVGQLRAPWQLRIDTLSVTMMLLVTGVGMLIHIYASGYMHGDARFARFFIYLNLFITSMLVLVGGDNYLMLFVGWEGVGLCSFLLIGFWYDAGEPSASARVGGEPQAGAGNARAGRKAFVVNRVGDFGLLLAILILFWQVGSVQFDAVAEYFAVQGAAVGGLATVITLLLLVGVCGKSAQIPLFVWLPDAMAGPTPVSALIHAATMVTAGIYLVARSAVMFELAPVSQMVVALVGATTAFMAGTIALAQYDIKRVLAYSTISQLGFMVAAVGLGGYVAGMFHLLTHAFFKALLFLSAGSVIHGVEHGAHATHAHVDAQDMRVMGGLRNKMPVTFWVYLIGSLALAGVFPLAGFWSKDEILADAWHVGVAEGHWHGVLVYVLLALAAFSTALYMTRQIILVFFGAPRSEAAAHAHESPPLMTAPLVVLALLSVLGGLLNLPGWHALGTWLEHTHEYFHTGAFSPLVAGISTLVALAGIALGYRVYYLAPRTTADAADQLQPALGSMFGFLRGKWFVDELYDAVIVRPFERGARSLAFALDWNLWHDGFHDSVLAAGFRTLAAFLSGPVDKTVIDRLFDGLAGAVRILGSRNLQRVQTGYVRNYALGVVLGVVAVMGYFVSRST